MATNVDDERAVLEVVEFSDSEDEGFDYKAVEVQAESFGGRGVGSDLLSLLASRELAHDRVHGE